MGSIFVNNRNILRSKCYLILKIEMLFYIIMTEKSKISIVICICKFEKKFILLKIIFKFIFFVL